MVIVILAIIGLIVIIRLLFQWDEDRRDFKKYEEKQLRDMAELGDKSNKLWRKYQQSLESGKVLYPPKELYKKLKQIINDPSEKMIIETNKKNKENKEMEISAMLKKHNFQRMKIYYLYHELIFQVFDTRKEISRNDIINKITDCNKASMEQADNIFQDCRVFLIEKCKWNSNYKIVNEFSERIFSEETEDEILTHEDWLNKNKKVREAISNDEIEFENLRKTNFKLWRERYY
ncbi:MAG TPA: hypothetical protein VK588_03575 [Chitinophagaceae bacterium]|nr:hypothetical protein [Chitinophagaceae bacterium]